MGSVKLQFKLFPAQIARFWVLWTHAFSASVCFFCYICIFIIVFGFDIVFIYLQVMLASVVTHGPRSNVAPAALSELKNACDLFEGASAYGGRAIKFLVSVRFITQKRD